MVFAPSSLILTNYYLPLSEALCFSWKVGMYKKGFFGFVFNHAIKEYKSLFKASIILMSVTLISLSQGFSVLTKYDYEAKKLEYLIVTQENTPLLKVKCKEIAKIMTAVC